MHAIAIELDRRDDIRCCSHTLTSTCKHRHVLLNTDTKGTHVRAGGRQGAVDSSRHSATCGSVRLRCESASELSNDRRGLIKLVAFRAQLSSGARVREGGGGVYISAMSSEAMIAQGMAATHNLCLRGVLSTAHPLEFLRLVASLRMTEESSTPWAGPLYCPFGALTWSCPGKQAPAMDLA